MVLAYASLFSCLVIERIGRRNGLCCLFVLLLVAFLSVAFERLVFFLYCFCIFHVASLLEFFCFKTHKLLLRFMLISVYLLVAEFIMTLGSA